MIKEERKNQEIQREMKEENKLTEKTKRCTLEQKKQPRGKLISLTGFKNSARYHGQRDRIGDMYGTRSANYHSKSQKNNTIRTEDEAFEKSPKKFDVTQKKNVISVERETSANSTKQFDVSQKNNANHVEREASENSPKKFDLSQRNKKNNSMRVEDKTSEKKEIKYFPVGTVIKLKELKNAAHYNGLKGEICSAYDTTGCKYHIKLLDTQKEFDISPKNIEIFTEVGAPDEKVNKALPIGTIFVLKGLKNFVQYNGERAITCGLYDNKKDKYHIKLIATQKEYDISPNHIMAEAGFKMLANKVCGQMKN